MLLIFLFDCFVFIFIQNEKETVLNTKMIVKKNLEFSCIRKKTKKKRVSFDRIINLSTPNISYFTLILKRNNKKKCLKSVYANL
jgi:hypothetical protein